MLLWPFRIFWKLTKLFFFCLFLLVSSILVFFLFLPNVSQLKASNPPTTKFMERAKWDMSRAGENPALDWRWVPLAKISPNLKKAVLVSEDDAFYQHEGFDWRELKKSLERNLKDKAFTRGGSTITQQLVKNLYLGPQKNVFRKLREWIITYQMEKTLSKDRILEIYLNVVEWGHGVYGAEAAARFYYGKPASALSAREGAWMASILPNPKLYSQKKYSKRVSYKTNLILKRMGGVALSPVEKPDKPTAPQPEIPRELDKVESDDVPATGEEEEFDPRMEL